MGREEDRIWIFSRTLKATEEPGPNVKIALKILSHLKQFESSESRENGISLQTVEYCLTHFRII